jgi:hypothetical protein
MSIPTILHVFNHSKAKKSHRLVLLEIANHVNDKNGLAWPSQTTIARRTGLSRRWVVEIIADLVAVGELKIIPEGGPNGEQAYSIPRGCELTSHPPRQGCELSSKKGVNSLHTESYIYESIFHKKSGGEGEGEDEAEMPKTLTRLEALKIGLTPGSKLFQFITGQSDE